MRLHALSSASVVYASALQCARVPTPTAKPSQSPLFSFGVIADVQWADAEDGYNYDRTVVRRYRGAFRTLERAVDWWNSLKERPYFIAQLGDILDGVNVGLGQSESALEAALAALRSAPCPAVNLVGNHELYNFDRAQLSEAAFLKHGDREYYSFSPHDDWRFVVLDPYQIALIGHSQDDPRRRAAVELIGHKNPSVDPSGSGGEWFKNVQGYDRRFVPYNGGLGAEQLAWLRAELAAAAAASERVVIMCHVILHPRACGGGTMVWDYPEVLEVLRSEEAAGALRPAASLPTHCASTCCPPPLLMRGRLRRRRAVRARPLRWLLFGRGRRSSLHILLAAQQGRRRASIRARVRGRPPNQ